MQLTMEDLKLCRTLASEAKEILDMIEEIRAISECVTLSSSPTGGAYGPSDKVGNGAAKSLDFQKSREETAAKFLDHVETVDSAIGRLQDSYQRRVLRLRYIRGLSWEAVQAVMNYSESRAYAIHATAIENLGIRETQE